MSKRTSQVNYLVKFFNFTNGTSFRCSGKDNIAIAEKALDVAEDNIKEIKNFISNNKSDSFQDCMTLFISDKAKKPQPTEVKAEPKAIPEYMGLLEKALAEVIVNTKGNEIADKIVGNIAKQVDDYVQKTYGTIKRKIEIEVNGKKSELKGILHEKFDTILKFVANDEPVFLTGPAGSGKNVICKQVADALGLKFYFTNAVTQEYKLTGFTDAMGEFQETQFYKAFKNGGLFMLDEMDASIPEVLVILNSAIANRYFDFPAPIGYVEAHPDFRVVSAGNTFGLGADYEYVGRNQLDMASLDRFAVVKIDYDQNIELAVCDNNSALVTFARHFRKACEQAGIKHLISYRAISRIHKMEKAIGINEAIETCLVKNMQKDDLSMILSNLGCQNKYTDALRKCKEVI